jgi:ParB-like chromosome segregation protein Spo0J
MEKITWNTEKRKIGDLKEFPNNPRKISKEQFKNLVDSIHKFDYVELIAIDLDNTIIAGHMRVKALKKIHGKSHIIEVRVPSRKLNEDEFKEYLVRSNLNIGSFDYDILANEWDVDNLLEWGFSIDQLMGHKFEDETTPSKADECEDDKCLTCGQKIRSKK